MMVQRRRPSLLGGRWMPSTGVGPLAADRPIGGDRRARAGNFNPHLSRCAPESALPAEGWDAAGGPRDSVFGGSQPISRRQSEGPAAPDFPQTLAVLGPYRSVNAVVQPKPGDARPSAGPIRSGGDQTAGRPHCRPRFLCPVRPFGPHPVLRRAQTFDGSAQAQPTADGA